MKSVAKRLLDYLQTHGSISSMEIINKFSVTRPAREIHLLREQGYRRNIITEMVTVKRKDTGVKVKHAVYWWVD
jgi:hypothetical protein